MVPLMQSSLFQSVITKVNITQSVLNKKKVRTLYQTKFQFLCSVSPGYNFAILMRGNLCSTPGQAVQLYQVSVLPYGEPCLQQHTALLSGVTLSFTQVLYTSFNIKRGLAKGEIQPALCGCLSVLYLWRSQGKMPWK